VNIGWQVKKLRRRLHLTQKEFAARVTRPTDYTYIGKIERDVQFPSVKFLIRLAEAYHVPVEYFFLNEQGTEAKRATRLNQRMTVGLLMEARVQGWLKEYLPELAEDFRETVEEVLKEMLATAEKEEENV